MSQVIDIDAIWENCTEKALEIDKILFNIPEYDAIPNTRIGDNKTGDYSKVAVYGALTGAGVIGASLAAKKAHDSNEEDEKDEKNGRYIEANTDNN